MSNRTHISATQSAVQQSPDLKYALYLMDQFDETRAVQVRKKIIGPTLLCFPGSHPVVEKMENFMGIEPQEVGMAAFRIINKMLPCLKVLPLKRATRRDCAERVCVTKGIVTRHWSFQ